MDDTTEVKEVTVLLTSESLASDLVGLSQIVLLLLRVEWMQRSVEGVLGALLQDLFQRSFHKVDLLFTLQHTT